MFNRYTELCDVVSLLAYCPNDKSYLLSKDQTGEFWLPSDRTERNCWKLTAQKLNFELFGAESTTNELLRINRIWLPNHPLGCVHHVIYKVAIKSDIKKKTKIKQGIRHRLQWYSTLDLERQKAHLTLRSPEVTVFTLMAVGDLPKDDESLEMETGILIEICEDNVVVALDAAAGAAVTSSPHHQLLLAAGYTKDDQLRLYREFMTTVYPSLYMSLYKFTQFMQELGWQKGQGPGLFRSADISGRGGISFLELLLWCAALEPATQHSGVPAEIRCRYIFRYFDGNRDMKLEYNEFKELVAAARAARQLPVDALSVARDADLILKQLNVPSNGQLPLADFLRGVGELRLRGTSSLLRGPKSISGYLADLQEREVLQPIPAGTHSSEPQNIAVAVGFGHHDDVNSCASGRRPERTRSTDRRFPRPDYSVALYTVRHRKNRTPDEMLELKNFDEEAVSASTARLISGPAISLEVLGPTAMPVEALTAIHYFATPIESTQRNPSATPKAAWSWQSPAEEANLGALLLRLAEAVRPICAAESRLLRLSSPVYIVGDLHGNLAALLAIEAALWPMGTALVPSRVLFLGDYVDRGPHGAELMAYLFAAKVQRPNGVLLIRGNHETRDIQKMFTFYNECVAKYGETEGGRIWSAINNVFDVLPLAAVVDDKVFCCHGGIPPPWVCPLMTAIDKVPSPLPRPAEQSSIAWELLWNDPVKPNRMTATLLMELGANEGFAANSKRGTGHVFDQTALDRFLTANQLSHVVRAHEVHQSGFMCQLRGRLVSVFSSSHYCGGTNDSGVALLEGGKLRLIRVNEN